MVEGAMCPSLWHASVRPGLTAIFPHVFWLPLLFTGRFQRIAASLQMSALTLLLCSSPAQSVPYVSCFSVPDVLGVHTRISLCSPRGGELQHALSPSALPP